MSDVFFEELGSRPPEHHLEVGSGSHAGQTARIMEAFEPVLLAERPSWVVVPGDVNFTLACSLVAALHAVAASRTLVWPLHPRVRPALADSATQAPRRAGWRDRDPRLDRPRGPRYHAASGHSTFRSSGVVASGEGEGGHMLTIGVVGPQYPDSFAENIACGFEDLGHRAVVLSAGRPALFSWSKAAGAVGEMAMRSQRAGSLLQKRPLVEAARRHHFDAFVVVDSAVTPESAEALGEIARPLCFWYPDAVSNLGRQSMFQASYDAVFSKEPRLVGPARDIAGLPTHHLPEACNPRRHRVPPGPVDPEPHLVVMGNYYPYRIRLLERLHRAGVPMRLYGNPFPRWMPSPTLAPLHTGRYVSGDEKARVFRGAAGVLNALHPAEIDGLNTRLFEATASGGCVISEDRAELGEYYRVGEEVLAFTSFDELVEQARWCIDHPDDARQVGDRAAARALAEHTFAHRLVELLEVVGLDGHGAGEVSG